MSTLASVYHKPPEQFVGQGRFGADAVQRAAIEYVLLYSYKTPILILNREQLQNARENPLAAAAAAAAVSGATPPAESQANAENLLDIDFDGSAPASAQKEPPSGMSGLEGLAGTPVRTESPAVGTSTQQSNNLDDLLGVFGNDNAPANNSSSNSGFAALGGLGSSSGGFGSSNDDDLMNGFQSLNVSNPTSPPPQQQQQQQAGGKKTNDDLLGLF